MPIVFSIESRVLAWAAIHLGRCGYYRNAVTCTLCGELLAVYAAATLPSSRSQKISVNQSLSVSTRNAKSVRGLGLISHSPAPVMRRLPRRKVK